MAFNVTSWSKRGRDFGRGAPPPPGSVEYAGVGGRLFYGGRDPAPPARVQGVAATLPSAASSPRLPSAAHLAVAGAAVAGAAFLASRLLAKRAPEPADLGLAGELDDADELDEGDEEESP